MIMRQKKTKKCVSGNPTDHIILPLTQIILEY